MSEEIPPAHLKPFTGYLLTDGIDGARTCRWAFRDGLLLDDDLEDVEPEDDPFDENFIEEVEPLFIKDMRSMSKQIESPECDRLPASTVWLTLQREDGKSSCYRFCREDGELILKGKSK